MINECNVNIDGTILKVEYTGRGKEVEIETVTCAEDIGDLLFNGTRRAADLIVDACVQDSFEYDDDRGIFEDFGGIS
jgi:hypothetical protein